MTMLNREVSLDSGSSVFSNGNINASPSRTPSPSPEHNCYPQTAPDSVLHLLEPSPVHPPDYSLLPPGGCPRFPIHDDHPVLDHVPPEYSPSVYKFDLVNRKQEWLSPYDPSPSRSWKTVIVELNSTQLNIYHVPSSLESYLVQFKLNAINTRSGSFRYLPSPIPSRNTSSIFNKSSSTASSSTSASPSASASAFNSYKESFKKTYESCLTSTFDRRFHEFVHSLIRPGSSFRDTFKLVRTYSLQHCKIGLASDYSKRRHVLRLRIENEQILLQWYDVPDLVDWNCALNVGKDLSLDLSSREIPKYRTVPRRRVDQRRNTTSESTHHSSTINSRLGRPRRATESDAVWYTDHEDEENISSYYEGRPSSRNQILADEYDYDSAANDNELDIMANHKSNKSASSISRSVSKLKIWKRRTSSQTSLVGSTSSLDSLAVPRVSSSSSLNNYNSTLSTRLAMTTLASSPSSSSPAPGRPSSPSRNRVSQRPVVITVSPASAPTAPTTAALIPSTHTIVQSSRIIGVQDSIVESDDEYDEYDEDDEDDEDDDEDDAVIEVGDDEELICQRESTDVKVSENEEDDEEDQIISVNPPPILKQFLGAPITATGSFTKWSPDIYPVSEDKHFKKCLRCIKPLLFDDSWLNKPLLKPTSISTCSYSYIRWKHEAGIEDPLVKDKEGRRKIISQMIIGDSSTLCKVPNHHLKEYIVGSHGLIPRGVTMFS